MSASTEYMRGYRILSQGSGFHPMQFFSGVQSIHRINTCHFETGNALEYINIASSSVLYIYFLPSWDVVGPDLWSPSICAPDTTSTNGRKILNWKKTPLYSVMKIALKDKKSSYFMYNHPNAAFHTLGQIRTKYCTDS